ncbi:MAG: hypothetical protein ACMXX5_01380 [Candidatus Woesearchaeota archaeon]
MAYKNYEQKCVICEEAITNPICPSCLERQVVHWVGELKPSLIPMLREIGESVTAFTHANTGCIVCGDDMNVCPHCYCKELYDWLKENEHFKLAEEFLKHFNFELNYRLDVKGMACQQNLDVT